MTAVREVVSVFLLPERETQALGMPTSRLPANRSCNTSIVLTLPVT